MHRCPNCHKEFIILSGLIAHVRENLKCRTVVYYELISTGIPTYNFDIHFFEGGE